MIKDFQLNKSSNLFLIIFEPGLKGPEFSDSKSTKASPSQEVRGLARERGGVGPCGEEFSAGLIFLCFVSFHLSLP